MMDVPSNTRVSGEHFQIIWRDVGSSGTRTPPKPSLTNPVIVYSCLLFNSESVNVLKGASAALCIYCIIGWSRDPSVCTRIDQEPQDAKSIKSASNGTCVPWWHQRSFMSLIWTYQTWSETTDPVPGHTSCWIPMSRWGRLFCAVIGCFIA